MNLIVPAERLKWLVTVWTVMCGIDRKLPETMKSKPGLTGVYSPRRQRRRRRPRRRRRQCWRRQICISVVIIHWSEVMETKLRAMIYPTPAPLFHLLPPIHHPTAGLKIQYRSGHWRTDSQNRVKQRMALATFHGSQLELYKTWLTPTDRATRCVTHSRHRAMHKAGRWVWSTGDGRRSTVDNTWRRLTCRREIILSSAVGEKHASFGNIRIPYLFDKYSLTSAVLSLDQKLWIQWKHDPKFYALAWSPLLSVAETSINSVLCRPIDISLS